MNLLQYKDKQTKKMVQIATQKHGFDNDKRELMMDKLALFNGNFRFEDIPSFLNLTCLKFLCFF